MFVDCVGHWTRAPGMQFPSTRRRQPVKVRRTCAVPEDRPPTSSWRKAPLDHIHIWCVGVFSLESRDECDDRRWYNAVGARRWSQNDKGGARSCALDSTAPAEKRRSPRARPSTSGKQQRHDTRMLLAQRRGLDHSSSECEYTAVFRKTVEHFAPHDHQWPRDGEWVARGGVRGSTRHRGSHPQAPNFSLLA